VNTRVVHRRSPLETDMFDGGDVLPRFVCRVSDVFDGIA
jgi:hypothetical protein